jgi:adenylate cyclase class 2
VSDKLETELKFIVADPAAVRASLLRLGAAARGRQLEDNIRLDDQRRSLTARRLVLRLRVAQSEGAERSILTVKAPGDIDDAFKSRHEVEMDVSDGQAMLSALGLLGFEPYWRYEKRREVFMLDDVEADLDELPYGWFLELEGSERGIRALAGRLGLDIARGLTMSYSEIFENVRVGMRLDMRDLTFAAFEGIVVDPRFFYR